MPFVHGVWHDKRCVCTVCKPTPRTTFHPSPRRAAQPKAAAAPQPRAAEPDLFAKEPPAPPPAPPRPDAAELTSKKIVETLAARDRAAGDPRMARYRALRAEGVGAAEAMAQVDEEFGP